MSPPHLFDTHSPMPAFSVSVSQYMAVAEEFYELLLYAYSCAML